MQGRWRSVLNSDREPANARLRSNEMWFRGPKGTGFLWVHVGDPLEKVWIRVYESGKCLEFSFPKGSLDMAAKALCERLGAMHAPPPIDFATIHRATVEEEIAHEREREASKIRRTAEAN